MELDIDLILEHVKIKLSITDTDQDELLELLCNDAYNYMVLYLNRGTTDANGNPIPAVPAELTFVLESVVLKRYRRLGAEGIAIEKIDVLTTTYETGDDFAEYFNIMDRFKAKTRLGFRFC